MSAPTTATSLPAQVPAAARFIPVASPDIGEQEMRNVMDCLRSSWISSRGEFIDRFELAFADYCGARHAIACNTGTAALHTALWAAGVRPGDEVIVPSLTYIATANAVRYCGAEPVFADADPETWNVDPADVERRITSRTRAIVPVHLFGVPADLGALGALADGHGLAVVEDAAEAHGATYDGRPVGAQGLVGIFSFYGNKIITTGEGGMVVTDDDALAARCRLFKGQGQAPDHTYVFPVVGQNYRMTNIEAAIGLAQLERVGGIADRRSHIADTYRSHLDGVVTFQACPSRATNANWMVSVVLPVTSAVQRDEVATALRQRGIETRPFFYPVHTMEPYARAERGTLPVATRLAARGISLPTWPGLTDDDVARVAAELRRALGR